MLFVLRTCKNTNLPRDAYTQDKMHTHRYLGVHTFYAARVIVLVVF